MKTGRADAFLRFIREDVKPFIQTRYRVKEDDATYAGASHGGLFGLYAPFHAPDTFQRYIIGSPSLHYNEGALFEYEADYAASHADLPARVFLCVGAREEGDDPLINADFGFVRHVRRMDEALRARAYPNLKLETRIMEGETHVSMAATAFSAGRMCENRRFDVL